MVKADAYGLGVAAVAPVLAAAGCRWFFVATLDEGIALRALLGDGAEIAVLNGPAGGSAPLFAEHQLMPVLNHLGQIAEWADFCRRDETLWRAAAIHFDTGMNRLGLGAAERDRLAAGPDMLDAIEVRLVMSHLACADERRHAMNRAQLGLFTAALTRLAPHLPAVTASLANSSGIFLGADFHFDLARPGIALYGGNPTPPEPNPMAEVVRLQGKIIQVRDVDSPMTVGYGATHRVDRPCRIATVPLGYADGFLRSLGNRSYATIGSTRVPVVGRVSMDLITIDVTALPAAEVHPGTPVELIGPGRSIDDVAAAAGTIGYEILTSLGARYRRRYSGGGR